MTKTKKPAPSKPWATMAPGAAQNTLKNGVHYSSKPVNTNAASAGVRLAAEDKPDLQMVGYATLSINRRITTYILGGAPKAAPFNQASSVIEGVVDDVYVGCTESQRQQIHSESVVLDEAALVGGEMVDARLRQLIVSLPGEKPVAVTPLHSPIFSSELFRRISAEREDDPEIRWRPTGFLGIGGANNQNAGRNIYHMTRPLVFMAPKEKASLRKAMAIHYNGVDLKKMLPRELMESYRDWREARSKADGEASTSTMSQRQGEDIRMMDIARAVLNAARRYTLELELHSEDLAGLLDPALDPVTTGLLDPSRRSREWSLAFGESLIRAIEDFKFDNADPSFAQFKDLDALIPSAAQAALGDLNP